MLINPKLLWIVRSSRTARCERILSIVLAAIMVSCGGASMSVPARQLISISVYPASADAVTPTGTIPLSASGTFDQMPTTQDALTAQWSSSDLQVATVDVNTGLTTCVAQGGPVTITASASGKKGTSVVNCLPSKPSAAGQCVYVCGSTRCGALTGYCSISDNGACRQVYAAGNCPIGKPANSTATDTCGVGIDSSRSCSP